MKADLHVHTAVSDSSCTIEATIRLAQEMGVYYLGIVDHDTVDGLEEALVLGKKYGIKIIPGIEISAYDFKRKRKVHILGYNFSLQAPNIKALCDPILAKRQENSLWQIKRLKEEGFDLSEKEVRQKAHYSTSLYKQHLMAVLVDKGYCDGIYGALYNQLFKQQGICDRDIEYVDAFAAVEAIKADGGKAVLAHPGQLDSYEIMEELREQGLDGIELYHEDHTPADYQRILAYAIRHKLILTGGSDFHGAYGGKIPLGGLSVPQEYWRELL